MDDELEREDRREDERRERRMRDASTKRKRARQLAQEKANEARRLHPDRTNPKSVPAATTVENSKDSDDSDDSDDDDAVLDKAEEKSYQFLSTLRFKEPFFYGTEK